MYIGHLYYLCICIKKKKLFINSKIILFGTILSENFSLKKVNTAYVILVSDAPRVTVLSISYVLRIMITR